MRNWFFPLIATLFFSIASILAQDLASLTIRVADPTGAVVPGASVVLIDVQRGAIRKNETNPAGFVALDSLPAGEYSLEVEKKGFNKYKVSSLNLVLRDRQTVSVSLKVGAAADTSVNVTDKLEVVSADAAQGVTLSQEYIQNLPVNGRSPETLILITPGVTSASGNGSDINANGLRSNTNYYTLDGVSVNRPIGGGGGPGGRGTGPFGGGDGGGPSRGGGSAATELISIDAMQEMKVQTSSFAPEFGRSPGAQIAMSSRGGTNQFHGSGYYYGRNDRFDANDWFANAGGYGRGKETQNRPGATFGGPIQNDKMFFFLSFEHLQLESPYSVIASVPNVATRNSATAALRPFLNAYPIPNGPVLDAYTSQYRAVVSNPSHSNTGSARLDRVISSSLAAFARFSYTPSDSQQRGSDSVTPNVVTSNNSNSKNATGGLTKSFAGGSLNDLHLSYSKFTSESSGSMDSFGGAVPLNDALVFPRSVTGAVGSFSLNVFGIAGYSYLNHSRNDQTQYNIVDSFTRSFGPHQLKVGGDYRRTDLTNQRKPFTETVSFNGLNGYSTSLLTGLATNAQVASQTVNVYPTYTNISAYAQDSWRLSQWTTVTYGLRWDLNPAPTSRKGEQPFALASSNLAGVTQNEPLYRTRYHDIAPRVGIAYNMDERPGREMVIRGGIGLFYDLGYGATAGAFTGAPFSSVRTLTQQKFPLITINLNAPLLPATRPYGQVFTADTTLQSPLVTQWNLTLERNFGVGQTVSVGYAGTRGRRLSRIQTSPTFSSAFDVLTTATNGAISDYHGLQIQLRKRLSKDLQAQVSYTYAHSIDSASNDAGFGGGFASLFGAGERGSSDYDIRHNINISGSYRLPAPEKGWIAAPIRNWFLDFLATSHTGLPFSIQGVSSTTSTSGATTTPTGGTANVGLFAQVRPDYLGQKVWIDDPKVPGGRRINLATFSIPTGFAQGNLGRNALRGFGATQVDLSLRKMISVSERVKLHLAVQGFNILNHPTFANVSPFDGGNLSSPNFGVVTRMLNQSFGGGVSSLYRSGGPRSMELSIRFQF